MLKKYKLILMGVLLEIKTQTYTQETLNNVQMLLNTEYYKDNELVIKLEKALKNQKLKKVV